MTKRSQDVILRHARIGTLTLDLLTPSEERFKDNHHNVPQLAKRLLDGLLLIKQRMLTDELPKLPGYRPLCRRRLLAGGAACCRPA